MTLKVRLLHILMTFTQVTPRLKNFLVGWLLVLGLKEGLVECATVSFSKQMALFTIFHLMQFIHLCAENLVFYIFGVGESYQFLLE